MRIAHIIIIRIILFTILLLNNVFMCSNCSGAHCGLISQPNSLPNVFIHIVPNIPYETWFNNLNLSRSSIVHFNRLRSGHILLPAHAYKLDLNDSPLCTLHISKSSCDLSHILFDCPFLLLKRTLLLKFLNSFNIPANLFSILNPKSELLINQIIAFILESGFSI